jgi:hypothetical protein
MLREWLKATRDKCGRLRLPSTVGILIGLPCQGSPHIISVRPMHAVLQLVLFWTLAFTTLVVALVLLNVYYAFIGNDLTLRSVGQEAFIAAVASLVEAGSIWLVFSFTPAAARALFIPALIVAIIYKCAHLEDWSRYDILLFLVFQIVIAWSVALLFSGNFKEPIIIWLVFGGFLAIVASFARSL